MKLYLHFRLFFFSTLLLSFFIVNAVEAKDPKLTIQRPSMAAKYAGQSLPDPIEIEAGQTKIVTLKFKNVGTETWRSLKQHPDGSKHVSAYTVEPKNRKSVFRGKNWISVEQTGSISKDVKPGEIGELAIELKAPEKIGEYTEELYLAAEDYSWVKGGYFFLKIKVGVVDKTDGTNGTDRTDAKANRFIQSRRAVEAVGGERIEMVVGFQNVGTSTWQSYGLLASQPTALASASALLTFADELWHNQNTVFQKEDEIKPGEYFRETMYFRAPPKRGVYTAQFHLQVNGEKVDNAFVELPVTVTQDAPEYYQPPSSEVPVISAAPPSYRFAAEPRIRVGLWRPPSHVQFRSEDDEYGVFVGENKAGVLPGNTLGVIQFVDGKYNFKGGDIDIAGDEYIRLVPESNPHAAFRLWNYERYVKWKGPDNFNSYRGALELRRGEITDDVWVINDILLEDYVRGIGENGNNSPSEYLKAQSVAQRSYAYATIHTNKYGIFDVVATTGDQLYLGVEAEKILPNFVAAVDATRGQMVIYDNNIVITPYFARAGCQTRTWTQSWGGPSKPWLVPVKTTYECARGYRRLGHGVGMAQVDASLRAKEEGVDWISLIKYYYTGVNLERVYE